MEDTNSSNSEESKEPERELVTPGGELSSGIVASEQNTIHRQIMKSELAKKGHIFTFPITLINRPPVDPIIEQRPLAIREPHNMHVQNLKMKMKIILMLQ